jgi:NADPH:quinone reductase-like Zn-dependent oxidoreductase
MARAYTYAAYGGPEVQEFVDLPVPTPGPSELLVAVHAAAVNPYDMKARSGRYAESALDEAVILGREASGVVEQVGQDVEGITVGDQVFGGTAPGSGSFAEYALLTAARSAQKPPQVSFTDAATLTIAGATAYESIRALDLASGQSLLVLGVGGGVGVFAAQLARDAGLFVLGTASEDKRALVESLDATLITYGTGAADRIREIMPDGVDAILDLVGGQALRDVAGLARDPARVRSAVDPAVAELGGSMTPSARSADGLAALARLVAEGKLDPHVEDVWPLDQAADAIAAVETGHARGKVVIQVR